MKYFLIGIKICNILSGLSGQKLLLAFEHFFTYSGKSSNNICIFRFIGLFKYLYEDVWSQCLQINCTTLIVSKSSCYIRCHLSSYCIWKRVFSCPSRVYICFLWSIIDCHARVFILTQLHLAEEGLLYFCTPLRCILYCSVVFLSLSLSLSFSVA